MSFFVTSSNARRRILCTLELFEQIYILRRSHRTRFAGRLNKIFSPDKREIPAEENSLRVAIIGCPNAGKSALVNSLVKSKVCAVSRKIDTTLANTVTALTEDNFQLVVVDSPGLVGQGHARRRIGTHSEDRVLTHPEKAIERAEFILAVQDATFKGEYLSHRVLHMLHRNAHIPSILVINKVDLVSDQSELMRLAEILTEGKIDDQLIESKPVRLGKLSSIIEQNKPKEQREIEGPENKVAGMGLRPENTKQRDQSWHALYNKLMQKPTHKCSWAETRKLFDGQNGWSNFKALFMVSALTGEGVDDLRNFLRKNSVTRKWLFKPEFISKKDPKILLVEHVRSALLNVCPAEVGYSLKINIFEWRVDQEFGREILRVLVHINCEHTRWARIVWHSLGQIEQDHFDWLQSMFPEQLIQFQLLLRVKGSPFLGEDESKAATTGEEEGRER